MKDYPKGSNCKPNRKMGRRLAARIKSWESAPKDTSGMVVSAGGHQLHKPGSYKK